MVSDGVALALDTPHAAKLANLLGNAPLAVINELSNVWQAWHWCEGTSIRALFAIHAPSSSLRLFANYFSSIGIKIGRNRDELSAPRAEQTASKFWHVVRADCFRHYGKT